MKPARKRRHRDAPDRALACALGVTERTIRAWKKRLAGEPPEIRGAMLLVRQGKQWQFDLPKEGREFAAFIPRLKAWASKFTRIALPARPFVPVAADGGLDYRQQRAMNKITREAMRKMGLDGVDRTPEVEILRNAMARKRCDSARATDSEGDEPENLSHEDWKKAVDDYAWNAAYVASKYQCAVKDFPRLLPRYLRDQNEDIRNGKMDEWTSGSESTAPRQPGPVSLHRRRPPTMTEAEIQAECERLRLIWPDERHWEQAEASHTKDWEFHTLCEAAVELLQEGERVTRAKLANLLFYDWKTQAHWLNHQRHMERARRGIDVFCVEELCRLGTRGISTSEFDERYSRADIRKAEAVARSRDGSELNRGSKPDDGQEGAEKASGWKARYGLEDDNDQEQEEARGRDLKAMHLLGPTGRPIAQPVEQRGGTVTGKQTPDDSIDSETARRVRKEFADAQHELSALTPDQRKAIEAALGRPLGDYVKDPFKET